MVAFLKLKGFQNMFELDISIIVSWKNILKNYYFNKC